MSLEFLQPINAVTHAHALLQPPQAIGQLIKIHNTDTGLPDLQQAQIGVIGVLENRRDINATEQLYTIDPIRKQFYELYPGNWHTHIVDLGDLPAGDTVDDTYYALSQLTRQLLVQQVIPIYLCGSQDLMYAIYRAFDDIQHMINVVNVDCRFDLGDIESPINTRNYIGKMVTDQPYNLFNYSNLGFLTYFNSQDEIELLEQMYFDAIRLGTLDHDIQQAEPILRDADLVGIDMAVVKASDTAFAKANPNGLSGKQLCTLARYAGISDRSKVFGVFEIPNEIPHTAAQLMAEIIWYFIEGVNYRTGEYPIPIDDRLLKYNVPIGDQVLIYYQSKQTGRWWIELPFITTTHNKLKKHTLLPCTRHDYQAACNQILPERWIKARRKNEI